MICFEISVNGAKVCTAGLPDGVLSFDVIWHGPDNRRPDEPKGVGHWSVGGRTEEHGYVEHVWWRSVQRLSEADVVTLRVITADHADEPAERERAKDD